jgi:hypothetical protein
MDSASLLLVIGLVVTIVAVIIHSLSTSGSG